MPEWEVTEDTVTTTVPTRQSLQEELRAEQEHNLLLTESIADLELALDDKGWRRINADGREEFTLEGRRALTVLCRTMAVANPLIKRGLLVRIGYIWGQGVQVNSRAGADAVQDVNAVVQRFWDDNKDVLTGSQAQEELERALGTDGEVFLAAYTSPLTGRVQVRSTPADEVTEIITNPEDRDEPWFYIRTYVQRKLEAGLLDGNTRVRGQVVKVAHPAIGYRPASKIKTLQGADVRWDAPMLHIPVNRLDGWLRGLPDVYAAIAWARAYKDFLTDWALLTKSLSTLAWKATGSTKGRAQKQADKLRSLARQNLTNPPLAGTPVPAVGQVAIMDEGSNLEAISKSGATIDSQSGKPLAGMAAAGMGLPVTVLLADPGITGARAVAETLDPPTILEMTMRRALWQQNLTTLLEYVIDQAAVTPRGSLRGTTIIDDWGRKVVTLTGDVEKTLKWTWPPLVDMDPVELLKALVLVEGTGKLPDLVIVRALLSAIGEKDVDEIIAANTDKNGNWIDPTITAGQTAAARFRAGEDPAAVA
jgi:hypothetical protein